MEQRIKKGDRIVLVCFNGTSGPEDVVAAANNYWRLIGEHGIVVDDAPPTLFNGRVLVSFDSNVAELGLACHNELANTLWLLRSDIRDLQS